MQPDDEREGRELTCFIIGPIGDKDAKPDSKDRKAYEDAIQVLEEVIKPACEGYGITPLRADQILTPGEIPEQVFRHLRDSPIVIADVTDANANVMYELGLRHTTGKLTIQIGERGRLPFDVAVIRTILFRRTDGGLVEARRKLAATIATGLKDRGDPVTATRVWFEGSGTVEKEPTAHAADDEEEPGFLEKSAATFEGVNALGLSLDASTAVIREINSLMRDAAAQAESVNASGGNADARLFVANTLAAKLENPATRLEVLAGDYRQSVERMNGGMIYWLTEARTRVGDPSVDAFRDNVSDFLKTAEGTWPIVEGFRQSLAASGEAARSLRRVNRRISDALGEMASAAPIFAEWRRLLGDGIT